MIGNTTKIKDTGKTDRNGKKVFEGDIMQCPKRIGVSDDKLVGVVEYWKPHWRIHNGIGLEPLDFFSKSIVIGSVYKNIKKLKQKNGKQ